MLPNSWPMREIDRRLRLLEAGGGGGGGAPHAASHASGGTDQVTLSESQITSLVADLASKAGTAVFTSVANGLAPLSGGGTANFLRADGSWMPPGGGGATVKETLVDIGTTPVSQAKVVVTDAAVTTASKIVVGWGAVVDADANSPEMDDVSFSAVPATGSFTVLIASMRDLIQGVFRLNYVTG